MLLPSCTDRFRLYSVWSEFVAEAVWQPTSLAEVSQVLSIMSRQTFGLTNFH